MYNKHQWIRKWKYDNKPVVYSDMDNMPIMYITRHLAREHKPSDQYIQKVTVTIKEKK